MNNQKMIMIALSMAIISSSYAREIINNEDATSKTFFSVNPQYSTGRPPHLSLYRAPRMLDRKDGIWGCMEAVIFGGQSTEAADLARYFMPFGKICIVVAESPDPDVNNVGPGGLFVGGSDAFQRDVQDVLARNFNIITEDHNFESTICFCPKQTFVGGALNYRQAITDNENFGLWFDVTLPVVHVRNSMNLCERITTTGSGKPLAGHPANMVEAFQQSSWCFGKISPCALDHTGIADIEFRLGYDTYREDVYRYGGFIGIIVPTGNRPEAKFLFEPIVGRNGHWGIIWGSEIGFELWSSDHGSIQVAVDMNNNYLFEHNEVRSFDLKDKQWSRYINVFTDSSATGTTPGINVFTKPINIRPRGTYQINTAFIFRHKKFEFEIGFNSYFRQSEEGNLCQHWVEGPAIAGVNGAVAGLPAESMNLASMRMWNYNVISQDVDYHSLHVNPCVNPNIPLYKVIKESDLNIQSALHPSTIANTIYSAVGYTNDTTEYPFFMSLGGSYQFSADNTSISRWTLWYKIGMSI